MTPYMATRHDPVVYYLGSPYGGIVKIGTTVNITSRLQRMRRLMPAGDLYVLATEPGGEDIERMRFRQFKASRQQYDWYWYTPELRAYIAQLIGQWVSWDGAAAVLHTPSGEMA